MLERSGLTHVDVLSLDVEGHEMMVLSGLNFSRITIETILLEPPCELKPLELSPQPHSASAAPSSRPSASRRQ